MNNLRGKEVERGTEKKFTTRNGQHNRMCPKAHKVDPILLPTLKEVIKSLRCFVFFMLQLAAPVLHSVHRVYFVMIFIAVC